MNYREAERRRNINHRNRIFKDPGIKGEPYILQIPEKNLYYSIRKNAQNYFEVNNIVWWPGSKMVSGHMLSSQVSCVNHLFFLRDQKDAALKVLKNIDPGFTDIFPAFENGYVGFEVVSHQSYLNEIAQGKTQTRGANCTSVDAMMLGEKRDGKKIQVLIEWKYTEFYNPEDKSAGDSGRTRKTRYDVLINDPGSPFRLSVPIENYYYEPFYQLMRQTLLAWQMIIHKNEEFDADDWLHLDVIPENNLSLRYKVTSPNLAKISLEDAWKSQLKFPEKYLIITPQKLLQPILYEKKYGGVVNYLFKRYW